MKKHSLQLPLLSMVGLFSALILGNHAMTVHVQADSTTSSAASQTNADASVSVPSNGGAESSSEDAAKSTTVTRSSSADGESPYQQTNQHSNLSGSDGNHVMSDALTDAEMKSETDETGSTDTLHVMKAPIGLDSNQAAEWLTWAKTEAAEDFKDTGRSQKLIQVAATAATKTFTIGDSSVPHVDAVDIASYQKWMTQADFNNLKANGVKSAIIKLSEGTSYANPYAPTMVSRALSAGLGVSFYHYAWFTDATSAASEAQQVIRTMQMYGFGAQTRIFADMEQAETATSNVAANLNQFWATLSAAGYTNHGVYTGGGNGSGYSSAVASTVGDANTWYAAYPYTPTASSTLMNFKGLGYGAWQFSSTAYVATNPGNTIDVSHDYSGVLGAAPTVVYDKITSSKSINLPGTIDQSSRADGFYSAPYNTNAATATPNQNARNFNGQTVQILSEATTSAGGTFYQVRFVNGNTYWVDTRAVKVGSFYTQSNIKSVNYQARIQQAGRNDGLYPDGPFNTKLSNIFQNSNAPHFNGQVVSVTAESTTSTGTYCQVTLNDGRVEWIDKQGLTTDIYAHIKSTTPMSTVAKINQAGRTDGLYSAPYLTNSQTIRKNTNASLFDGQAVTIIAEAKTDGSINDPEGNDFYQIRLNDGRTYWINAAGVQAVPLDRVVTTQTLNLEGTINQAGRQDGLYSAPWNTDVLSITENHNAVLFNGQSVQVLAKKTTTRSAVSGNEFYQIKLSDGRQYWIDARGVKTQAFAEVQNLKSVNYDAQVVQNGRADGLYSHPYLSDADSMTPNQNALQFAGRGVKVTQEGTTAQGTYAKAQFIDGSTHWIDIKGLQKITYDKVTNTQNMNATGTIVQTGRQDGLYSAPWYTDALSITENHNAVLFNGQRVQVLAKQTTNRSVISGNEFYQIKLTDGRVYWTDVRGIKLN